MAEEIKEEYEQTSLWKSFERQAKSDELVFVKKLVEYAESLLPRYVTTFPNYTEHSGQHQINIIKLIGNLLGDKISDLTVLEHVFLILAAYYHDIGMVFKESEKESIPTSSDFVGFLEQHSKAKLQFYKNSKVVTDGLIEWYCRWAHAKRVYVYLDELERPPMPLKGEKSEYPSIKWHNKISLREKLGLVCESHNWDVSKLKGEEFDVFHYGEADLRFCSILLRLADYLDFDSTRTQQSIFNFLGLNKPKSLEEKISKKEWLKHLASEGFKFTNEKREQPYEIKFLASPNEPSVEYDINIFLDDIEKEISRCQQIIGSCSERWNKFQLPNKINREILSQNYKFGDFKFSLDQNQVLDLLMGENLYENPNVFIREILQNAIDTSRHREFQEQNDKNTSFKSKPIEVSYWEDSDGYRWVRVDDFGMGMNEDIIKKYFLKVGNSYYNSDEFEIEKLKYQESENKDFTPISRFGIGILSCFMAGDIVEVSTFKYKSKPIRLSIKGLHGFYTLQSDSNLPGKMPSEIGEETGYRTELGTSIAVRFDPSKENVSFDIETSLNQWLFCPPIPVKYKGKLIGGDPVELLENPICQPLQEMLTDEEVKEIETFLNITLPNGLGVNIIPIDFTNDSFDTKYLKGQGVVVKLTEELEELQYTGKSISIVKSDYLEESNIDDFRIKCSKTVKKDGINVTEQNYYTFSIVGEKLRGMNPKRMELKSIYISHNGIFVDRLHIDSQLFGRINEYGSLGIGIVFGYISLYDKLRPDLTVSRDKLKDNISWELWSNLAFATKKILEYCKDKSQGIFGRYYFSNEELSVNNLANISLLNSEKGWESVYSFYVDGKYITFQELRKIVETKPIDDYFDYVNPINKSFLYQKYFDIEFVVRNNSSDSGISFVGLKSVERQNLKYFPPLRFIHFKDNCETLHYSGYLNLSHPFCEWFVDSAEYLKINYNALFQSFLNYLDILSYSGYSKNESRESIKMKINVLLGRIRKISSFDDLYKPPYKIDLDNKLEL